MRFQSPGLALSPSCCWPSKKALNQALTLCIMQRGFGFFDGGCLIFAQALCHLLPETKVVTILRGRHPDHYGVKLPDGRWADFDGPTQTWMAWAERYCQNEHITKRIDVVETYVSSQQIPQDPKLSLQISEVLKRNPLSY